MVWGTYEVISVRVTIIVSDRGTRDSFLPHHRLFYAPPFFFSSILWRHFCPIALIPGNIPQEEIIQEEITRFFS